MWAKLHSSSAGVNCGNNQKYLGATSELLSSEYVAPKQSLNSEISVCGARGRAPERKEGKRLRVCVLYTPAEGDS